MDLAKSQQKKLFSWKRLIPFFILLIGLGLFFYFRLYRFFNFETLKHYRSLSTTYVQKHIILASLIYIIAYIILTAISAPGAIFLTLIGGFLFGPILGTIYVVIGATVGACLIFLAAKTAFHDVLYAKAGKWFLKIANGFKNNAISYMLFLRLVPLFPFWIINIGAAFLGISFRVFALTTFFGILPGTFVYVMLGNGLGVIFDQGKTPDLSIIFKPEIFIPLIGLGILSLIPVVYKRFKRERIKN